MSIVKSEEEICEEDVWWQKGGIWQPEGRRK